VAVRRAFEVSLYMSGSISMHEFRLPDARPPRYANGVSSASSHPELVSGDLAIAPRRHVPIMALNRSVASDWRRAIGGLAALAVIVVLVSAVSFRSGATLAEGEADKQRFARTCMQWHLAAGTVVSRLVQSTRDADLLQVNDSVFRMRRARRNCEAGWVALACQDYHAVAAALPGYAMTNQLFPCAQYATVSPIRD
jgi:hypothetical protein